MRRAAIEFGRGQRMQQHHYAMGGVVGELRIGGVALHPVHSQAAGQAATPTNLDHVAKCRSRSRLSDDAAIEHLATSGEPFKDLLGAVDADRFLVAGDQQADRTAKIARRARRASTVPRR